ncbi:MAG: hypothetical protein ACOCRK_02965 [bacterium]
MSKKLEKKIKKLEDKFEEHIEHHVLDDILKETYPGSGRWLYTYSDIAKRWKTNSTNISRIAKKHNMSRRKSKK